MKLIRSICVLFLLLSSLSFAAQDLSRIVTASGFKGGLIVHVGCGDGKATAELYKKQGRLVLGLDSDSANVQKARTHFLSKGVLGKVVAEKFSAGKLPLLDDTVNLLISETSVVKLDEIKRVLAPEGVAYIKSGTKWKKMANPRPSNIDAWTHYLHGADNNAVAADTAVDQPFHMRWDGEPRWQRSHDYLASMSALVSDGKKLFYIFDEGETSTMAALPEWMLVARDAFNGIILWKRPIKKWEDYLRGFRSGPVHLPRSLVVADGRLYTYLGYDEPLVAIDPDSGKTLQSYAGTEGVREILFANGLLYLVVHEGERENSYTEIPKSIVVLDAKSGKKLWEKTGAMAKDLNGSTLAVGSGVAVYDAMHSLVCVNAETGKELWKVPGAAPVTYEKQRRSATLISGDTVLWSGTAGKGKGKGTYLAAYDLKTGKELWRSSAQETFFSPVEMFVIKGQVWSREGIDKKAHKVGYSIARDLRTGKVTHKRPYDGDTMNVSGHGWCYMNKATERYLIRGRSGVDFLSTESDEGYSYQFVRGTCSYGVLPCNGLLYTPPHSCACYINAKMNGFIALAPKSKSGVYERKEPALEKGPAFGQVSGLSPQPSKDWPTFRADAERSASVSAKVNNAPSKKWETKLPGKLSSPVYADGRVYVSSIHLHTVYALSGKDGSKLWSYTTGGRVDTPPTVHKGHVLFGSADGWVYCLRASDGKLVWRFRASDVDLKMVSYNQVESVWPVPGNIMVIDDKAYFAAGRSSYIDGGMTLYALDVSSGKVLKKKAVYDRDSSTGAESVVNIQGNANGKVSPSILPDVLSSNGKLVFLRQAQFDFNFNRAEEERVPHVFSSTGFADDSWWQRTCQMYTTEAGSGFGWGKPNSIVPAGRVVALDGDKVLGFGRTLPYSPFDNFAGLNLKRYHIFSVPKIPVVRQTKYETVDWSERIQERTEKAVVLTWSRDVKVRAKSLLIAGDKMVLAGPENPLYGVKPKAIEEGRKAVRENKDAFFGRESGLLEIASKKDGKTLGTVKLDSPPVFHGMIAADGGLVMATEAGTVVRME